MNYDSRSASVQNTRVKYLVIILLRCFMAVLWLMLNDRDCLKEESGSRGAEQMP